MGAGRPRETIRSFFAVELAEAARQAAANATARLRAAAGGSNVRWVRPEAYHVTLRFLGEIAADRVPVLAARTRTETAGLAPFELRLGAVRAFPSPNRPRVVVLNLEPVEPLAALAAAVERAVVAEGFVPERRPFRGHVTLGRVRAGGSPRLGVTPEPVSFPVRSFVLFRSVLAPSGATYTPLERVALGGEDSPSTGVTLNDPE